MQIRRLIKFVGGTIVFIGVVVLAIFALPIEDPFQRSLIIELFGSGVVATIITGLFYFLQERGEYQAKRQRSQNFLQKELIPHFQEALLRGIGEWDLYAGREMYFDHSFINPFYSIIHQDIDEVRKYLAYFPEDAFMQQALDFYIHVRKGYVLGEKLDQQLYDVIRNYHHAHDIPAERDQETLAYVKAQLMTEMSDHRLITMLHWDEIPESAKKIHRIVLKDSSSVKTLETITDQRNKYIQTANQIANHFRQVKS